MKIFVLHPNNKISKIQRKFMTTIDSKNVFNIALDGNFDDCQKFVKSMFADKKFSTAINMSGVNSINWARIIIQIVYYFYAYFKTHEKGKKINFSVPTGNFGDVYAGYVAKKMGLPINKLIIATNSNDILNRVIKTGIYKPQKVEQTVSPSMDIQVASNFERLIFDAYSNDSNKVLELMNNLSKNGEFIIGKDELKKINANFCSESLSESETKLILSKVYKNQNILIDPHTAVGFGSAEKISLEGNTIILSTAHSAKFSDIVMKETNVKPELPDTLKYILTAEENYIKLNNDLTTVKNYILDKV